MKLLSGPKSSSRSNAREFPEVFALQRSNNADGPSSLLKSTGRSTSLPPWVGKKNSSKMRRLVSAPRRLQAATELMPEAAPKKGYDGNLSANLVGLSLVLVQRGSITVGMCLNLSSDMFVMCLMRLIENFLSMRMTLG
jgi:hypothetical protein